MDFMAAGTTSCLSPLKKKYFFLIYSLSSVTLARHREGGWVGVWLDGCVCVCVIEVFLKGLCRKVYCGSRLTALI